MENNKRPTQCQRIVDYMKRFGSITTLDAFVDLGVMRLGARICELRKAGYEILGVDTKVRNRFDEVCTIKKYYLQGDKQ